MARVIGRRTDEAPARNDVYVGMLGLTALAMAVGVAVLALEATEYEWDAQPKAGPALSLPSAGPAPKAPAGG